MQEGTARLESSGRCVKGRAVKWTWDFWPGEYQGATMGFPGILGAVMQQRGGFNLSN